MGALTAQQQDQDQAYASPDAIVAPMPNYGAMSPYGGGYGGMNGTALKFI